MTVGPARLEASKLPLMLVLSLPTRPDGWLYILSNDFANRPGEYSLDARKRARKFHVNECIVVVLAFATNRLANPSLDTLNSKHGSTGKGRRQRPADSDLSGSAMTWPDI